MRTAPLEGMGGGAVALEDQGVRLCATTQSEQDPSPAKGMNPSGDAAIPPQARAGRIMTSATTRATSNVLGRALRPCILATSCSLCCGCAIPTVAEAMGFTYSETVQLPIDGVCAEANRREERTNDRSRCAREQ